MVRGESFFERECWMYPSTSCGEISEGKFLCRGKEERQVAHGVLPGARMWVLADEPT